MTANFHCLSSEDSVTGMTGPSGDCRVNSTASLDSCGFSRSRNRIQDSKLSLQQRYIFDSLTLIEWICTASCTLQHSKISHFFKYSGLFCTSNQWFHFSKFWFVVCTLHLLGPGLGVSWIRLMYTVCSSYRVLPARSRSTAWGPRILVDLVSTHFLAHVV